MVRSYEKKEDPGSSSKKSERITYAWAGVYIEAASDAVELIKQKLSSTMRKEVLAGPGGFASMFELDLSRYKNPVIVSGTDGVGTKLKLAQDMNKHDTVGIDLVAMCADDVVTCGAEPLFFQDYIAAGKVIPERIAEIVVVLPKAARRQVALLSEGR